MVSVILAPVLEEFLFRGVLLRGYAERYGFTPAAILSSTLFGLSHEGLQGVGHATIFGIFSALLYGRTGSLLPCITAHALVNLSAQVRMIWPEGWLIGPFLVSAVFLGNLLAWKGQPVRG